MSKGYDRLVVQLKEGNFVDDRLLFTFTNIKRCPFGLYGYSFVSIKGDSFYIYDADFKGPKGEPQVSIKLSDISDVKLNTIPLIETLKFNYHGEICQFSAGFTGKHEISKFFKEMK